MLLNGMTDVRILPAGADAPARACAESARLQCLTKQASRWPAARAQLRMMDACAERRFLPRVKVFAHGYRSRRTRCAARNVTEAQIEPQRVEAGLEDDERVARLSDVALGEPDERCAHTLACSRRRDVEAFDRVACSMKPGDNQRATRSDPHFISRDRLLHAWNAAAPRPVRCLAKGQMRERELPDGRLPNFMEGHDIGGNGRSHVRAGACPLGGRFRRHRDSRQQCLKIFEQHGLMLLLRDVRSQALCVRKVFSRPGTVPG